MTTTTAQILAVHGFAGSGSDFDALRHHSPYRFEGWAVAGHHSGPQPISWNDEVTRLAKMLPGRTVLGYSMGARLALAAALIAPPKRLILISATAGIESDIERAQRVASDAEISANLRNRGMGWFGAWWPERPILRSQQAVQARWRQPQITRRDQLNAHALADALDALSTSKMPNLWGQLNHLVCPVLLITGAKDHKYEQLAKRMAMPRATHHSIAGVGHAPHLEAPKEVATAITSFLSSYSDQASSPP